MAAPLTINESKLTATDEIERAVAKVKRLTYELKRVEAELEPYRDEIKKFMGGHGILMDRRGVHLVTYCEHARQHFNIDLFREKHPRIAKQFTEERYMRVFLVK